MKYAILHVVPCTDKKETEIKDCADDAEAMEYYRDQKKEQESHIDYNADEMVFYLDGLDRINPDGKITVLIPSSSSHERSLS